MRTSNEVLMANLVTNGGAILRQIDPALSDAGVRSVITFSLLSVGSAATGDDTLPGILRLAAKSGLDPLAVLAGSALAEMLASKDGDTFRTFAKALSDTIVQADANASA
jgi:hypothetical protein